MIRKQPYLIWMATALLAVGCHRANGTSGKNDTRDKELSIQFLPTIENRQAVPGTSPQGMVWIPGGEFSMGANDPPDMDDIGMRATLDARPIHRVFVDGFYMDQTDVTNAQFNEFVNATGYLTIAERTPRPRIFPVRGRRILSPAALFFLRQIILFHSTATFNGGLT